MKLLDSLGRLLRRPSRAEMLEEDSAPEIGSVRQIEAGHPADGLTPERLAAILRSAEAGDATAYLDLAEQMEEKDLHYAAVLGVRKRAIRGLDLIVEAGDDSAAAGEAADMVRATLAGPVVRETLIDMLDALGKGFSVCEIVWALDGGRWSVEGLEHRPPRFFEFDRVNGRHLRLRGGAEGEPLKADKYVVHIASAKSGLPIRGGLARLAAWAFMFKNYSIKDWSIFLEAYGHPLRLGKYEAGAASEADRRTLLRAARSIGVDMAAIIPSSMQLEVIETNSRTTDSYERKARWWDEQLSKGILGQVATTDAIAGGHAVGKIHEAVREDIRDADADQLAITLMRDLARPLTRWNFGDGVPVPLIRFREPELVDPKLLLQLMAAAGPAGLRIAKSDVYRAFSLREPDEDDDVLEFPAPAAPLALPAPPRALPAPTRQTASRQHDHTADGITAMIDDLIASGQMQAATAQDLGPLLERLRTAGSYDEALRLLDEADALPVDGALTGLLARSMFAARLAGEAR